jgi:hypothetical protein
MSKIIVIFVEGATELEFYKAMAEICKKPKTVTLKFCNLQGAGRFEQKVPSKLKREFIPTYGVDNVKVVCCYDTDVFEQGIKPPTNWDIVKQKVEAFGISNFELIGARKTIEDWFIMDIEGVCNFLKIKSPTKVFGKDGLSKMKNLFKKGGRIYQKGSNTHKFIPFLDIPKIETIVGTTLQKYRQIIENKIIS